MLKFEVADMEDLQAMDCVNPHDIFHSPEKSSQQLRMDFNIRVQQQQDQASKVDVYSLHSDVTIPAGNRKIAHIKKAPQNGTHASQSSTIEMEQFQNLDTNFVLYEANFDSSAVVNELNTPVFEKNNPFDLDVDSHSCPSPYQYSFNYVIKEEPVQNFGDYHSVSLTPAIISDNQSSYTDSVAIDHQYQSWQHSEESSSSLVIVNPSALNIDNSNNNSNNSNNSNNNSNNNSISDASLLSPATATNEMLLGDFQQQSDDAGNMFDKHGYFDVLVPSSVENVFDVKEEEPSRGGLLLDEDDSANCRLAVSPRLVIPPLGNLFGSGELVSTPDVITAIEAIEADHEREFNILHCISEQDIVTSSDIISSLSIPSTITKPQPFNFTNTTASNNIKTSNYINPTSFPQKLPPTTSLITSTPTINISTTDEQFTAQSHLTIKSNRFGKFPRRRPAYDDDDEDYIPPTSKRQRRISTVKPPPAAVTVKTQVEYDSDVTSVTTNNPSNYGDSSESSASDSDEDDDTFVVAARSDRSVKVTKKSRGRPPTTTTTKVRKSTASSSSFVNKYREMRDKNNEASRKSRLKKKQKEHTYHSELDDMELRNVQLKAQVSELQSTVQTFRANLMNILLTKK